MGYWECKKTSFKGKFKVHEMGHMIAYFDKQKNGHFDKEKSKKIQLPQKSLISEKVSERKLELLKRGAYAMDEKRSQKIQQKYSKIQKISIKKREILSKKYESNY